METEEERLLKPRKIELDWSDLNALAREYWEVNDQKIMLKFLLRKILVQAGRLKVDDKGQLIP